MTVNYWFSLIGSIGLIGTGSLIGSLITVIVTHFLEKGKLKTERQSNLQKEIYFKLQEQAGKTFEEINLTGRQVEEMKFWLLKRGTFTPSLTNTPIIERISKMSSFQVYFPKEILEKYNETAIIFKEIAEIYFETGKTDNLSQENRNKLNRLLKKFKERTNELVRDVLTELERNKNLII